MIPLFKVFMSPQVDAPLLQVLHSGYIGQGAAVNRFEDALAQRFSNPRVMTLSAGTHGLHLALKLAGVKAGDEVITTPLTCTATNWPIFYEGAVPVWADIKDDFNIDPKSVKARLTAKTKAIVCVHWGGYPCDLQPLGAIAAKAGVALIEDAAHAYGATYMDHPIGDCTWSRFTMMSFQAIKSLTAIDGGALFCRQVADLERGKLLRWYGIDRDSPRTDFRCEQPIPEWGYKYHMNDVCATVGLANMADVEENLAATRRNAAYYDRELAGVPGVRLTQTEPTRQSSYWLYTMLVEKRSDFCTAMASKGISVSRVHERNDKHPCTAECRMADELPNLERILTQQICIPVGWWLTTEQREYIVSCIQAGW
jgi:dTDP-4-amino-4,6-dideoxygalactose transaminase